MAPSGSIQVVIVTNKLFLTLAVIPVNISVVSYSLKCLLYLFINESCDSSKTPQRTVALSQPVTELLMAIIGLLWVLGDSLSCRLRGLGGKTFLSTLGRAHKKMYCTTLTAKELSDPLKQSVGMTGAHALEHIQSTHLNTSTLQKGEFKSLVVKKRS